MKRFKRSIAAIILSAALLAGCGKGTAPAPAEVSGADSTVTQQPTEAVAETVTDTVTDAAPTEQVADDTAAGTSTAGAALSAEAAAELSELFASYSTRMGGGFVPNLEIKELEEYSEEDVDRLDRAMRGYKSSGKNLLINKAKSFYFYDQLDKTGQDIYDSIYLLAQDPVNPDNVIALQTNDNVTSDAFNNELLLAYFAILADHPELFWMNNAIKTDVSIGYGKGSGGYKYAVYFLFNDIYKDFEKDMEAFNKATEAFMKTINLKQDDYKVARDIHDKLIDTVKYDDEVCEKGIAKDLAHTAYGALVENSRGDKNMAVCDGYSYAYLYLLQQAGIEASVIYGYGGPDEKNGEGHAWNVVKLGGDWYEVDSTWDDMMDTFEALEKDPRLPKEARPFVELPLKDSECGVKMTHYMYNLTTKDIRNYKSCEDNWLIIGDEYIDIIGDSVHIRDSEKKEDGNPYCVLMEMAPTSNGKKYR